jgi:NADPH:quinone reductase-like Zn-dependent oxidoreductase
MLPTTMRHWRLSAPGRHNLTLDNAPVPQPGPGEVLVKVGAVALNYRDKLAIDDGAGIPPIFPFTPGSDLCGVVVATGDGARRLRPGQRVISTFEAGWLEGLPDGTARHPPAHTLGGVAPGVLAEYVPMSEDWFVTAPASLDDAQASTLPVAGLTAWSALVEHGRLHAGQTVLIQGTGGVSLCALQLAVAHGATAIVTSSSDAKLERAKALGAAYLINHTREDWVEAVYRITHDRGVDHVLEMVGGAHLGRALEAVAVQGRVSLIGVFDGFTFSGSSGLMLRKQVTLQGISVGHRRALEALVRAVDRTGIQPVIDRRYPLAALPAALDHLSAGPFGKVVIEMA